VINIPTFNHFLFENEEYEAVKDYQNGFISDMQRFLRSQPFIIGQNTSKYKKEIQSKIEILDRAISKSNPIKIGTILWRGITDSEYAPHKNFEHSAFMSVSKTLNKNVEMFSTGGIKMKLIVDGPIKGIDINSYLKKSDIDGYHQEELLLERGLYLEFIEADDKIVTYKISSK
jgi:hypothetical protein